MYTPPAAPRPSASARDDTGGGALAQPREEEDQGQSEHTKNEKESILDMI